MPTPKNSRASTLLLIVLATSSFGCAQPSPPAPSLIVSSPRLPPPDPRLMVPPPTPESFSVRVQESFSRWADKLAPSPAK